MNNDMNNTASNDIKKIVEKKIEENNAMLAELNVEFETAQQAHESAPSLDNPIEFFKHCENYENEMTAFGLFQENKMLGETLTKTLVKACKRFVITDGELTSPSGFHTNSLVFVKNDVWIESDRLPRMANGLNVYDMKKIAEAA
jgi:hypothetical protein